eukprot:scpid68263/ scgid20466/ Ubiquitin carboxyl-terminal hydrolase 36; Deubiquitinating enzyme 36; Ubiquitin thioesterase 36; Ubiquitin-specific-processing protease 36
MPERRAVKALDSILGSNANQLIVETTSFVDAKERDLSYASLKEKRRPLNMTTATEGQASKQESSTSENSARNAEYSRVPQTADDGLPVPKRVLFEQDRLSLRWRTTRKVGCGLFNLGNTCFLNSVIQCLAYTPPLVAYLESGEHTEVCRADGYCAMCALTQHVKRVFSSPAPIKPGSIASRLKFFAKHFRFGRQEDAHEFLRYFTEALQKCCLSGLSTKIDSSIKATTLVHQVFGGYHRSLVLCSKCKYESKTFDPLLDVSLDIKNANSVTGAFEQFIKPDILDGANKYMCPKCKSKVNAKKMLSIHRAPNVLTIQLKRFDFFHKSGGKINKKISYSPTLNLRPYMSEKSGDAMMYDLYAVLVHSGHSVHSGHYYCFTRTSTNACYCLDDASVRQVGADTMLTQQAYLLFYVRRAKGASSSLFQPEPRSKTSASSSSNGIASPSQSASPAVRSPAASVAPASKSKSSSSHASNGTPALTSPSAAAAAASSSLVNGRHHPVSPSRQALVNGDASPLLNGHSRPGSASGDKKINLSAVESKKQNQVENGFASSELGSPVLRKNFDTSRQILSPKSPKRHEQQAPSSSPIISPQPNKANKE